MKLSDKRILFFDGVCNLCNGFVNQLIRIDPKSQLNFASLQSEIAKELLGNEDTNLSSVVFYDSGQIYKESNAIIKAIAVIHPFTKILLVIPRPLRDATYKVVAKNRYKWFGRRTTCRIPTPEEKSRILG